jgi:hypothetical protein
MNERGYTLLDALWSLGIASIILSSTLTLFTTLSRLNLSLSWTNQGVITSMKVHAVIATALRSLERNRLPFAAQVMSGSSLVLPHGGQHPLSDISGPTSPRSDSDILSIIDLAHRHHGRVLTSTFADTSVTAEICGIYSSVPSTDFKSFILYTLEGPRQVVGAITYRTSSCISLTGTSIRGIVSSQPEFTSHPITFVPIEREYSLFVDRSSHLRIASHVGGRITENQPIVRGVEFISISTQRESDGVMAFMANIKPTVGPSLKTFILPGLSQRMLWNEILP